MRDALGATKDFYATCPKCGKKHPVPIPDAGARARVIETILTQSYGRPGQADDEPHERKWRGRELEEIDPMELSIEDLEQLTYERFVSSTDLETKQRLLFEMWEALRQ